MDQVRHGYKRYLRYIRNQSGQLAQSPAHKTLEDLIEANEIVVGTPDDAIEQIRRLERKVPDFGCLLVLDKNWAEVADRNRSLEMLARYVLPAINSGNQARQNSFDWCRSQRDGFITTIEGRNQAGLRQARERGNAHDRLTQAQMLWQPGAREHP